MSSNSFARAAALALSLVAASCSSVLPWRNERVGAEVNLAFLLEDNLIRFQTVRVDHRPGRFILGSAAPQTVLDPDFGDGARTLQISETQTLRLSPAALDLGGVADAIIGVEAWRGDAITIDYRKGLVTYQRAGIHPGLMTIYRYESEPTIYVNVDGVQVAAVVDTTSPDTVVLPSNTHTRGRARVVVAGADLGDLDVQYANVSKARVGNRILSRFMVTIDYGKRVVGLWLDTRGPIEESLPAES
jgi:hypothetical protein